MHEELDQRISEIRQEVRRRDKIDATLAQARRELSAADEKRQKLKVELEKEGADVTKLEGMSFTNLMVSLFGDKDRQLDKEKKELAQAQLRYEEHLTEVSELRGEVEELEARLQGFAADLDDRYRGLMGKKERALLGGTSEAAQQLTAIAEQVADASSQGREIGEAVQAGNAALAAIKRVDKELNSAKNWGNLDMLGGGFLTTMIKHGKLDGAKKAANEAGKRLRHFGRELQDVQLRAPELRIDIGGFAKFADFFMDGLLFDWVVQSKIGAARKNVAAQMAEVRRILGQLQQRGVQTAATIDELQQKRAALLG